MVGGGPVSTSDGISSGSKVIGFMIAGFAAFGGILFGYDTGTIGGVLAMTDWLNLFGTIDPTGNSVPGETSMGRYIKTSDKSLVVSILSVGTFFGALLASPFADRLGRRYGLIASCAVFCVGVGMQLDTHWAVFVIGRVVAGLGVGLVSCQVPMYQSECAPKSIRGLIMGMYQLSITIGALLATIVLNATKNRPNHSSWRIPIALQFAWAGILVAGMLVLPETPRFLLTKGKEEAARKSLSRLIGVPPHDPLIDSEVAEITLALEAERETAATSYRDCFTSGPGRHLLRTLTGIFLQAMQQLTGINFIIYYGTTFFESAGISNAFLISIAVSVVNTGMCFIGIQFIDRVGRRSLLIWGGILMCVCEFIVAIVGTAVGKNNTAAQKVLVAFTCIYVAGFAISWGPIAWVITGEIYPNAIRAKAMSLATASNWLWNWAIGYATPYLVDPSTTGVNGVKTAALGSKVFFIWGTTCALSVLYAFFLIPETKGLSLEQVDLLYRESTIRGSKKYGQQMKANNETFLHHQTPYGNEKAVSEDAGLHKENQAI